MEENADLRKLPHPPYLQGFSEWSDLHQNQRIIMEKIMEN